MGRFYARWVWANGWSELVGLGGTLSVGWLALSSLGQQPSALVIVLSSLTMVIVGALLEGAVVGYAQARVLAAAPCPPAMRPWVAATVIGAGVAWLLGMIPSTAVALAPPATGETATAEGPQGLAALALAAVMGLVLGPILATPQYFVLRRAVSRAGIWIPANAIAWAFGMVVVFGTVSTMPASPSLLRIAVTLPLSCLLTGAVVGAIHGAFLVRLQTMTREA